MTDNGILPVFPKLTSASLDIIFISPENTRKQLSKLNSSFHTGPDNIPSFIFKIFSFRLSSIFSLLFNLSFNSGSFPSIWKDAISVPIFKKSFLMNLIVMIL